MFIKFLSDVSDDPTLLEGLRKSPKQLMSKYKGVTDEQWEAVRSGSPELLAELAAEEVLDHFSDLRWVILYANVLATITSVKPEEAAADKDTRFKIVVSLSGAPAGLSNVTSEVSFNRRSLVVEGDVTRTTFDESAGKIEIDVDAALPVKGKYSVQVQLFASRFPQNRLQENKNNAITVS